MRHDVAEDARRWRAEEAARARQGPQEEKGAIASAVSQEEADPIARNAGAAVTVMSQDGAVSPAQGARDVESIHQEPPATEAGRSTAGRLPDLLAAQPRPVDEQLPGLPAVQRYFWKTEDVDYDELTARQGR